MTTKKRAAAEAATHTHTYSLAQNPKQKPRQNIRLAISTAGISIGVALLFIAAAADMTVSTGQITELCVLGTLSAFGGMAGLKWEGVLDR